MYLSLLKEQGYSVSHCTRVKSVINHFCQWLVEDKEVLMQNPTCGVEIKVQQTLAPRILSPDQRFVLRTLIEKEGDLCGKAIFALGYWAGCCVSDMHIYAWSMPISGPRWGGSMWATKGKSSVILIS
jgi:site-specific recombinase XerC